MASYWTKPLTRRDLLKIGVRGGIGVCAVTGGSLGYAEFEPHWVEVTQREVTLPRLPAGFDGFRIVQISDIHLEGGDMRNLLPDFCRIVTKQAPDLIVLTGDFISITGNWLEDCLVQGLAPLQAPHGVFAILGNHDHWTDPTIVRRALARAGIPELRNSVHLLHRQGDHLALGGIDDFWTNCADVPHVLHQVRHHPGGIFLGHEPDFADEIAPLGAFDLMLSGHSHGGQVCLPFRPPLYLPAHGRKYPRGLYQLPGLQLYTNRGLGTLGLPVRVCARPEITVFRLRAGAQS